MLQYSIVLSNDFTHKTAGYRAFRLQRSVPRGSVEAPLWAAECQTSSYLLERRSFQTEENS